MAIRYFLNIGVNWGDTANWSDTSGGTGGFSVPTNVDDVFFDANSGNCTVNASARTAKTLDFTGYTNTITMSNTVTVSGNVTLGAGMGIAGASALIVDETSTLTSNGKTWSAPFTFSGTSKTFTLGDNWAISGQVNLSGTTATTINSNTLTSSGNLTSTTSAITSGTTNISLTGGTWSNSSTGALRNNLTFTSGTITVSGIVRYDTNTLTYTSGTVTTTGSTLAIAASTTLNTSTLNWNTIFFGSSAVTITLTSDLYVNNITINLTANHTINGNNLYVSGNLNGNGISSGIIGTTNLKYIGTGFIGGRMSIGTSNFEVNTPLGTLTIAGDAGSISSTTVKYTAGNVVYTGSLTVNSVSGQTLDWIHNITGAGLLLGGSGNSTTLLNDIYTTNLRIGNNGGFNTTTNGFKIYCSANFTSINFNGNNLGTTEIILNGSGDFQFSFTTGTGALRNNLIIDTPGTINIIGTVRYDTGTLTYLKGSVKGINTPTLSIQASGTFINLNKLNVFSIVSITSGTTQTFNNLIQGTASYPTRVQCATATGTYTIAFQDTFEKIANNVKVSGCIVSRPGQLIVNGRNSNKGNNTGIRFGNQSPNGLPKNTPTIKTETIFGIGNISDPTMVIS